MKYIYQHMGLGDHLICNGLVRTLVNNSEQYTMFVKSQYRISVEFMYRDIPNIKFLEADDNLARQILSNVSQNDIILIGFIYQESWYKSFEVMFYQQHSVPLNSKWDNFGCHRDKIKELELFEKLDINPNEEYIFVHDDERYRIDMNRINSSCKIVKPIMGVIPNIFDYCSIIEKAKEVHTIESSFAFLIDNMGLNQNFIIHRHAKKLSTFETPEYKNVKKIIN